MIAGAAGSNGAFRWTRPPAVPHHGSRGWHSKIASASPCGSGRETEAKVPTYQYACTTCDHRLEVVQSFSDEPLTQCPTCDGRLRKLYSAVGIVFKGSGFYRTDSRSGGTRSDGSETKKTPVKAGASSDTGSSGAATSSTPASSATPAASPSPSATPAAAAS